MNSGWYKYFFFTCNHQTKGGLLLLYYALLTPWPGQVLLAHADSLDLLGEASNDAHPASRSGPGVVQGIMDFGYHQYLSHSEIWVTIFCEKKNWYENNHLSSFDAVSPVVNILFEHFSIGNN